MPSRNVKYMLDTNICIYLIRQSTPNLTKKFDSYRKGEIVISAITWAELCCGIQKHGEEVAGKLLSILDVCPFGLEQGCMYGELSSRFPNRKANLDRLIASHAMSLNAVLVTNNVSDFIVYERAGLRLENWVSKA